MRILIVNNHYRPILFGGAEKSVSLLAEALARSGDEVSVITLHSGSEETVEELNGVRVYRVPLDNTYWPWGLEIKPNPTARLFWHLRDIWNRKSAKRIGRILDIEVPDVVHTNELTGFSISVWREVKKRGIRLVHTLRGYYMLCDRLTIFRNGSICEQRCWRCRIMSANRKLFSHSLDALVSNSAFTLKEHTRHGYFKEVQSFVIYNIAESTAARSEATKVRDANLLVFGFIGNVRPDKGLDVVLEACGKLANPNWRLRIAGAGLNSYVEDLKQRFTDSRIEWLGFVDSMQFYESIDVSVISSVWAEPLPRTLIETFAAGKSAICARSGGIPEIASLGKIVEMYPAKDVEALARIMDDALTNVKLWKQGGFKDSSALDVFSEASITSQYRAVYQGDIDAL